MRIEHSHRKLPERRHLSWKRHFGAQRWRGQLAARQGLNPIVRDRRVCYDGGLPQRAFCWLLSTSTVGPQATPY